MEKKRGRPFGSVGAYKEIKRDKQLTLRLSESELEKLKYCSNKMNKSRTNVLVELLNEQYKKLTGI